MSTARCNSLPALVFLTLAITFSFTTGQAQAQAAPQYPDYPSETPADFHAPTAGMDYERRDVMIAMRDGVKLHTVILVAKGTKHAGILLTRTPTALQYWRRTHPAFISR